MKIKVCVTQDHIDQGKRWSPDHCPIALAIQEATGKAVRVKYSGIYVKGKDHPLPPKFFSFMEDYDSGKKVSPFESDWEYPEV